MWGRGWQKYGDRDGPDVGMGTAQMWGQEWSRCGEGDGPGMVQMWGWEQSRCGERDGPDVGIETAQTLARGWSRYGDGVGSDVGTEMAKNVRRGTAQMWGQRWGQGWGWRCKWGCEWGFGHEWEEDGAGDKERDTNGDVAGGFSPPTTSTPPRGRGLSAAPPHPAQRTPGSPLGGHRDTPRHPRTPPPPPPPPLLQPRGRPWGVTNPPPPPHGCRPTAVTGRGAAHTFSGGAPLGGAAIRGGATGIRHGGALTPAAPRRSRCRRGPPPSPPSLSPSPVLYFPPLFRSYRTMASRVTSPPRGNPRGRLPVR